MLGHVGITEELVARFRWIDGHADVWRLFSDRDFFPALVAALADPLLKAQLALAALSELRAVNVRLGPTSS
jgi:hypothetical protein